ncbi:hypothetical protein E2C01_018697 [Portunus trituberculatus]|uniref:Uncharacterized protein n=1 Tax=Portunus trituberculatus TaxID=210409 RepID=A0A5B7DWW6_PORTR|nr:hypothetical protein [Portunus trituberculatus]
MLDHQQGIQHTQHAGDVQEQTLRQRRRAMARSAARKRRHKKLYRTTAPFSQSTTFIQFPPGPEQRQVTLSSDDAPRPMPPPKRILGNHLEPGYHGDIENNLRTRKLRGIL